MAEQEQEQAGRAVEAMEGTGAGDLLGVGV